MKKKIVEKCISIRPLKNPEDLIAEDLPVEFEQELVQRYAAEWNVREQEVRKKYLASIAEKDFKDAYDFLKETPKCLTKIEDYFRANNTTVGADFLKLSIELIKYDLGEPNSLAEYMTEDEQQTTRKGLLLLLQRVVQVIDQGVQDGDEKGRIIRDRVFCALGLNAPHGVPHNNLVPDDLRDEAVEIIESIGVAKGNEDFADHVRSFLSWQVLHPSATQNGVDVTESEKNNSVRYVTTDEMRQKYLNTSDSAIKKQRTKVRKAIKANKGA